MREGLALLRGSLSAPFRVALQRIVSPELVYHALAELYRKEQELWRKALAALKKKGAMTPQQEQDVEQKRVGTVDQLITKSQTVIQRVYVDPLVARLTALNRKCLQRFPLDIFRLVAHYAVFQLSEADSRILQVKVSAEAVVPLRLAYWKGDGTREHPFWWYQPSGVVANLLVLAVPTPIVPVGARTGALV